MQRAARWLFAKEVRRPGDWSLINPRLEPGGWFFEDRNGFYPDVDDTAMVMIALISGRHEIDSRKHDDVPLCHGLSAFEVGCIGDVGQNHVIGATPQGALQIRGRCHCVNRVTGFSESGFEIRIGQRSS